MDTPKAFFEYYREVTKDFSTDYSEEQITWNMISLCPKFNQKQADDVYIQPGFFKHLKLYPNAYMILEQLKLDGHYLHIVSCHKVNGMEYKIQWIKENLPMINEITIIPIEHGMVKFDKSSVSGDILVDDKPDALDSSSARYKVCFSNYEWNKDWQGIRANNWRHVYKIIRSIKKGDVS